MSVFPKKIKNTQLIKPLSDKSVLFIVTGPQEDNLQGVCMSTMVLGNSISIAPVSMASIVLSRQIHDGVEGNPQFLMIKTSHDGCYSLFSV